MKKTLTACLLALCLPHSIAAIAADDYTIELYELYCQACHGVKGSGAPQAFNSKEWDSYLKKGIDAAVNNSIKGINNMPPMGTCAECGPTELKDIILHMSRGQ